MRHFVTLLLKEEKAIFSSPIAYATVAVFLLLMGYTFTAVLFINRTGELVRVFFQAAVLFLLIVPVVTMRLFAEERRAGTLELLLTSPVKEIEVVLAKFTAGLSLPVLMLALTAIGLLVSGFTANQIVAAVVAMGMGILLWMIDTLGHLLPEPYDTIVSHLSLVAHFTPFATGALFLSDVGFFLTIVLVGLFLSVRTLARR